jgi:hypothetical protein
MVELQHLRNHLAGLGRVVLGYSGGVDSALLAVIGAQTLGPQRFLAVTGRSASYPGAQAESALDIVERFHIPVRAIDTLELDDPRYLSNSTDRCYFWAARGLRAWGPVASGRAWLDQGRGAGCGTGAGPAGLECPGGSLSLQSGSLRSHDYTRPVTAG